MLLFQQLERAMNVPTRPLLHPPSFPRFCAFKSTHILKRRRRAPWAESVSLRDVRQPSCHAGREVFFVRTSTLLSHTGTPLGNREMNVLPGQFCASRAVCIICFPCYSVYSTYDNGAQYVTDHTHSTNPGISL